MEQKATLIEKLERILIQRVKAVELEAMSLGEMLYYALVESGDDRGLMRDGAMQGV
jgi:hypothetical protein